MTIAYLIGENSIWKIKDKNLLTRALENPDGMLVRVINSIPHKRGRFTVEYLIITEEEFFKRQLEGQDILYYYKEDIASQLKRLEKLEEETKSDSISL